MNMVVTRRILVHGNPKANCHVYQMTMLLLHFMLISMDILQFSYRWRCSRCSYYHNTPSGLWLL